MRLIVSYFARSLTLDRKLVYDQFVRGQNKNPALPTFPTFCKVVSSAVPRLTAVFGMGTGRAAALEARGD